MPAEDVSNLNFGYLFSLPNEILLQILQPLSLSDLMQLRATSKDFRTFITSDLLKQLGHTLVNYRGKPTCETLSHSDSSILTLKIINPDIMACGTENGQIVIWNLRLNKPIQTLPLRSAINIIERLSDDFFVSGSESGAIRVWDLHRYQRIKKFTTTASVSAMALVSKNILAIGFKTGSLIHLNLDTGMCNAQQLCNHAIWILKSCSNNRIAAGCGDGVVSLIDLHTNKKSILNGRSGPVAALAVSPDKSFLATGSSFGYICVWNLETLKLIKRWMIKTPVWSVAITLNGLIITGSHDGFLRVWDPKKDACVNTIQAAAKAINTIVMHPDAAKIICACENGTIHIYTFPGFPKLELGGRAMLQSSL